MSYDVTLVEVDGPTGSGFARSSFTGFPSSFDNFLFSIWCCLPQNPPFGSNGNNLFTKFFEFDIQPTVSTFYVGDHSTHIFSGTFPTPIGGVRSNLLISVQCSTQTVQLYLNDQPVALASGGWTGSGTFTTIPINIFQFVTGNSGGVFPAFADQWINNGDNDGNFVDLTVTANRRKFINADLTPVDTGTSGQNPFGAAPVVFQTVPAAGVPNDFLVNRGTGLSPFSLTSGASLSFQAGGTCTLPPSPPDTSNLRMDNVVVQCLTTESPCTAVLFPSSPSLGLRWSDTRGLTWGNPVPQDFSTDPYWQPQWNRTGYARDRVFELFWTAAYKTAVNGAFVEVLPLKT